MKRFSKLFSFTFAFILLFSWQSLASAEDQYVDVVPKMTAETTDGVKITQSSFMTNFGTPDMGWKAFDDSFLFSPRNFWYVYNIQPPVGGHYIKVDLGIGKSKQVQKVVLSGFPVSSTANTTSIKNWELYGSNDDITWTLIIKDTHPDVFNQMSTKGYEFVNDKSYRFFRINILNSHYDPTGKTVAISEMELMEKVSVSPNVPPNLTGTVGNTVNNLQWDAVEGATGYNVKRSLTPGGPYETIGTNITGTTYVDDEVTNGTTYYYVVTAVNVDGESGNSNEVALTPEGEETPPPSGDKALLRITMTTGEEKEYDLSASEVGEFINWYQNHSSSDKEAYVFTKDFNKGPFTSRKEYVAFSRIQSFEVMEYSN